LRQDLGRGRRPEMAHGGRIGAAACRALKKRAAVAGGSK
jgi:hypothetical protein